MVDNKSQNHIQKKNNKTSGKINVSIPHVSACPVTKRIITNAGKVNYKLMQLDMTRDKGNRYLGTYIFFKRDPFSRTDVIAKVVLSEKKLNIICPTKR